MIEARTADRTPLTSLPTELSIVEAGRIVMARLHGALDEHQGAAMLRRLRTVVRPSRRIVLDLRGTDFLDSGGVRALLLLQEEISAADADLRLILNARGGAARTLSLLKLQSHFRTFEDASGAWYRPRR